MQAVCPKCNTLNPISNQFCGNCGASLESAKVVQEIRGVEPKTRRKRFDFPLWLAVSIVIVCAVIWVVAKGCGGSPSRETKTHDTLGAWVVAQQFVEDRLVSPGTADYPCCYDDFTTHLGGGRYRVESYVDSQNRMGALLRTYFTAEVQWIGDDNWRLESLDMD